MHPLAALLVALAAPLASAQDKGKDKDEDKAREVAAAYAKALKAKDLDAVMKVVDVPFVMIDREKPRTLEKADELKADLKAKLDAVKDTGSFPTEVSEVLGHVALRKEAKTKDDEAFAMMVEKFIGDTGYVVRIGKADAAKKTYVLIRVKDGKAKVVGTPG